MSTSADINIDDYLEPLDSEDPDDGESGSSGVSVRYLGIYDEIEEARRADDGGAKGDWEENTKVSDWNQVVDLGLGCLRAQSKDLMIAAWVTEALGHLHGFAGLSDGFRLMKGIQDRFWADYHPQIDEEDGLISRAGPFVHLNDPMVLPLLIRSLPITGAWGMEPYSALRYAESRKVDNAGRRDANLQQALLNEGKITGEQFDNAAAATPLDFYEDLAVAVAACVEEFNKLDEVTQRNFKEEDERRFQARIEGLDESGRKEATRKRKPDFRPSLTLVREALTEVRTLVEKLLKQRREQSPPPPDDADETPEDEVETPDAPYADDSGESSDEEPSSEYEGPSESDDSTADEEPVPRPKPARRRASGGPIVDRDDAIARIQEAAAFLRSEAATDPVPYLVVRALRLAELYARPPADDPEVLASPASETRQRVRRLAIEQNWPDLLDATEAALGGPEGRAWLDAHRQAVAALEGIDAPAAAAAVRALLRAVLADFPDLPDAELVDGTPTANAESRAWLRAQGLLGGAARAPEPAAYTPEPLPDEPEPAAWDAGASAADREPDAWDHALEQAQAGGLGEGLAVLRDAWGRAAAGRERFRRRLQMAELCLMHDAPRVALPLLDDLARQVDEARLEAWEDPALIARVWGALLRGLRQVGAEPDRQQAAFDRLCRLDAGRALHDSDGVLSH